MTAIRRGWLHLASGAGVGRVFGFASNLLLSRWLGPSDLGLFNLVTTTVQTCDTLVRCGGDYAINYELGGQPDATQSEHGAQLARGFAQICSLMTAFLCLGVGIWVFLGNGLFTHDLGQTQRSILSLFLLIMIASEGISASAWELLLVSHQTALLALKPALFYPLRVITASAGAFLAGIFGAMAGWSFIAIAQFFWLKCTLKHLWNPLTVWPLLWTSIFQLWKRGLPFYVSNLLSSLIFYPLLLKVSSESGLAELGYLRVGQIIQQVFALLPGTLVPVLFLRLRGEPKFSDQVLAMEKPLRLIWFFLLSALLLYCMSDQFLITWLFGAQFESALLPTRVLLATSLFESLTQLFVQPVLASGRLRFYGAYHNIAAITAAVLGWLLIPSYGLAAYLIVRLLYVLVPFVGFSTLVFKYLHEPKKIFCPVSISLGLLVLLLLQIAGYEPVLMPLVFLAALSLTITMQWNDLSLLSQFRRSSS